jgi:hypothetical protein
MRLQLQEETGVVSGGMHATRMTAKGLVGAGRTARASAGGIGRNRPCCARPVQLPVHAPCRSARVARSPLLDHQPVRIQERERGGVGWGGGVGGERDR